MALGTGIAAGGGLPAAGWPVNCRLSTANWVVAAEKAPTVPLGLLGRKVTSFRPANDDRSTACLGSDGSKTTVLVAISAPLA